MADEIDDQNPDNELPDDEPDELHFTPEQLERIREIMGPPVHYDAVAEAAARAELQRQRHEALGVACERTPNLAEAFLNTTGHEYDGTGDDPEDWLWQFRLAVIDRLGAPGPYRESIDPNDDPAYIAAVRGSFEVAAALAELVGAVITAQRQQGSLSGWFEDHDSLHTIRQMLHTALEAALDGEPPAVSPPRAVVISRLDQLHEALANATVLANDLNNPKYDEQEDDDE